MKEVCGARGIPFIDVFHHFPGTSYLKALDADGVHPNAEGHRMISEIVKDFLVERGWI